MMKGQIVVINERKGNIEKVKTLLVLLPQNCYVTSSFFLYFVLDALREEHYSLILGGLSCWKILNLDFDYYFGNFYS